jgi:hypothetical protein
MGWAELNATEDRPSLCVLGDDGVSTLAQTRLGTRRYRNQLVNNAITSTGVGVLLETMEQNSHHITDLDLRHNPLGTREQVSGQVWESQRVTNLTRLSLLMRIGDDGS